MRRHVMNKRRPLLEDLCDELQKRSGLTWAPVMRPSVKCRWLQCCLQRNIALQVLHLVN
jgi:hypothetical protein